MSLAYVTITGTYKDGSGAPLTGAGWVTPSGDIYDASGSLVISAARIPVSVVGGALQMGAEPLSLLATDNAGLSPAGRTAFWFWTICLTVGGEPQQPAWSFFLPSSPGTVDITALASSGTPFLPLPSGTPAAGDVAVVQHDGSPATAWQAGGSGGGSVDSVTAADASVVVGGTLDNPTVATGTLDAIATAHPPAASVPMNGHKHTGLAHGAATGDSVAWDQLGTAAFQPSSAFDAAGAAAAAQSAAESFASGLQPATGSPLPLLKGGTGLSESTSAALLAALGAAPLASPALTGTPAAPTAAALTDSTVLATTAYADAAVAVEASRAETAEALKAPLASPALTGTPTAPTKTPLTDSTALATTAYADAAVAAEASRAGTAEAGALPKSGGTMTGWLAPAVVALSQSGGNVAVDWSQGSVFTLTLGGNWAISNPASPVNGQVIRMRLKQDGTGTRVPTWGGEYDWGSGNSAPALSTAAGATDYLAFEWDADISKAVYLGAAFPQGF